MSVYVCVQHSLNRYMALKQQSLAVPLICFSIMDTLIWVLNLLDKVKHVRTGAFPNPTVHQMWSAQGPEKAIWASHAGALA